MQSLNDLVQYRVFTVQCVCVKMPVIFKQQHYRVQRDVCSWQCCIQRQLSANITNSG